MEKRADFSNKRLEEIDRKEFGEKASFPGRKDSTNSDNFDAEDDDDNIDDLLYDDDDIPGNKSPLQSSLVNSPKSVKSRLNESPLKKSLSRGKSFEISGDEKDKNFGLKGFENEANSFGSAFTKDPKPSISPKKGTKKKSPIDLFLQDDEEEYLGDLGVDKLEDLTPTSGFSSDRTETSPQKLKSSRKSFEVEFDEDNDILDSLESASSTKMSPSKSKRQSFMDDLLGKDTARTSVKKLSSIFDEKPDKSSKEGEKDDVMVYGGYVPSAVSTDRSSRSGRRQSVMFKDEVEVARSPLTSPVKGRSLASSDGRKELGTRNTTSHITNPESAKPTTPSSRTVGPSSKLDDIFSSPQKSKKDDWLDFLKEDTKTDSPKSALKKTTAKVEDIPALKDGARRKSSSAEWLGLGSGSPDKYKPESKSKNKGMDDVFSKSDADIPSVRGRGSRQKPPWLSDSPDSGYPEKVDTPVGDGFDIGPRAEEPTITKALPEAQAVSLQNSPIYKAAVHQTQANASIDVAPPIVAASSSAAGIPPSAVPATTHIQSSSLQYQQLIPQPQVAASNLPEMILQSASSQNAEISRLQSMVTSLQFEKNQLLQSSELLSKRREEDAKQFEENIKNQQKSFEESLEIRLKSVRESYEADIKKLKEKLEHLEQEKKQLSDDFQLKIQNLEQTQSKEVLKLKELHNESVAMLKQNHEDAITRLKRLKDQEVEAITSTQLHTKSLQSLSDQLEERASELAALQRKVEEKHQAAFHEKEAFLMAKEKELKALEGRLRWQMEEGEQERSRLQQLVLRLEKRLEQQTKEGEEDHWGTLQLKTKLEVQRKYLEEEKKTLVERLEADRDKLRVSQNALFAEQKAVLVQLAEERQQLTAEKHQFEILAKRVRDEDAKLTARKLKEDSNYETQKRMLDQENEKVYLERQLAKQETLQVQAERQALEREKKRLADEKESLNEMRSELKRRSEEVEALAQKALFEREEGRSSLASARKMEAEHHLQIREFTQQMQEIMQHQKELMQEREKFCDEKRDFEKTKANTLCINCKLAVGFPVTVLPPNVGSAQHSTALVAPVPHKTDPNLMVWYITAEKDRQYLREELSYLKSLKELGQ